MLLLPFQALSFYPVKEYPFRVIPPIPATREIGDHTRITSPHRSRKTPENINHCILRHQPVRDESCTIKPRGRLLPRASRLHTKISVKFEGKIRLIGPRFLCKHIVSRALDMSDHLLSTSSIHRAWPNPASKESRSSRCRWRRTATKSSRSMILSKEMREK